MMAERQMAIPVDLPEASRPVDDRLRLLIERVERLDEERKGISDDIRDVYAEAKAVGYDVKDHAPDRAHPQNEPG